jgi:hypothetical protein
MVAALPGLAYLKPAIPDRPWDRGCRNNSMNHALPQGFDPQAARVIAEPLDLAGIDPPVTCSEPLVEPNLLEGPAGAVVVLANFSGRTLEDLEVSLDLGWSPSKVVSVRQASLRRSKRGKATLVSLPLDVSDILLVHR